MCTIYQKQRQSKQNYFALVAMQPNLQHAQCIAHNCVSIQQYSTLTVYNSSHWVPKLVLVNSKKDLLGALLKALDIEIWGLGRPPSVPF